VRITTALEQLTHLYLEKDSLTVGPLAFVSETKLEWWLCLKTCRGPTMSLEQAETGSAQEYGWTIDGARLAACIRLRHDGGASTGTK
jgi:hypothetical protein